MRVPKVKTVWSVVSHERIQVDRQNGVLINTGHSSLFPTIRSRVVLRSVEEKGEGDGDLSQSGGAFQPKFLRRPILETVAHLVRRWTTKPRQFQTIARNYRLLQLHGERFPSSYSKNDSFLHDVKNTFGAEADKLSELRKQ